MLNVDALLFLLLDVVVIPFARHSYFVAFLAQCYSSTALLAWCCCYSSCLRLLLLLARHDCSSCWMLMFFVHWSISLLHLWYCCSLFLGQRCCFCSSCFRLVLSSLSFCKCGKSCPNSSSLCQIWKMRIFVCWWIFLIIHVFEKCWLTMCLLVVCSNYLNIVHLIIHIAFHLYNCIVYFFNTLHLFFYGHKKCWNFFKEI